ncbi:MAG: hypothetical protein ACRYG5_20075 [Janthinobacterium lividum]
MYDPSGQAAEPPAPFPVIRGLLARKKLVLYGGAIGVALLGFWLAFRTGFVELYPIAIVLAFVTYFVLQVAVEVVELVAETLMPR